MTRVEKFHQYREEIANMKVEDNSSKKLASNKIDEIRNKNDNLNYNDIISFYELENTKGRIKYQLSIEQILYLVIGMIIIITLLMLIIIL